MIDDATLAERLNAMGRLAEGHVAAGTSDTGSNEITNEEADRIIASVRGHGATIAQLLAVLANVAVAYRAALTGAINRSEKP